MFSERLRPVGIFLKVQNTVLDKISKQLSSHKTWQNLYPTGNLKSRSTELWPKHTCVHPWYQSCQIPKVEYVAQTPIARFCGPTSCIELYLHEKKIHVQQEELNCTCIWEVRPAGFILTTLLTIFEWHEICKFSGQKQYEKSGLSLFLLQTN